MNNTKSEILWITLLIILMIKSGYNNIIKSRYLLFEEFLIITEIVWLSQKNFFYLNYALFDRLICRIFYSKISKLKKYI